MNTVERVKKICKVRRIPIYTLESACNFGNGYIGKLTKGTFPHDRLLIISKFLNIPKDYLLGVTDEYGLIPDQWDQIGLLFSQFCSENKKSVAVLSKNTGIKQERINDFFNAGIPLTRTELLLVCQEWNVPLARVIKGYEKYFNTKTSPSEDGELAVYLEDLRERPETRALLEASRGMTKEQVEQMAAFIKNMRGEIK